MSEAANDPKEAQAAAIIKQLEDMGAKVFFEKSLTSSDASGSGRVVIPKAIAEQYFPRLEQQSGLPVRCTDTRGNEYTFKFRFWINNQSRMYLLEGAGELHHKYKMNVGDVMVFAQKGDGSLVLAGRPATKNDVVKKPPIKRPAEKPASGGPGRPREPKRTRTADGAPAERGRPGRKKKVAPGGQYSNLYDLEPAVDGIFRAVPQGINNQPGGVAPGKQGRWVVTLNLAGELYQAFFDTQEDAMEAYNASGAVPAPAAQAQAAAPAVASG